jgi:hypothetical protein
VFSVLVTVITIPRMTHGDQQWVKLNKPSYTISKETTYLTEPLKADGSVDYARVLDERARRGVTPENNAAVLFWKAVGIGGASQDWLKPYFAKMGMTLPPADGTYFVKLSDYSDGWKLYGERLYGERPAWLSDHALKQSWKWRQLGPALERPWSSKEFPLLAKWLAANEKPLALVVEASKRSHYYSPRFCREGHLFFSRRFDTGKLIDTSNAIGVRATLRLGEGRVDEAWQDLLSCHRLARIVGKGHGESSILAGAIDSVACNGARVLLEYGDLTSAQIMKMRADVKQLPALPQTVDFCGVAGRFYYLDTVSLISRTKPDSREVLDGFMNLQAGGKAVKSIVEYADKEPVDWNLVLRKGNQHFDRITDALSKTTHAKRCEALTSICGDFPARGKMFEEYATLEKAMKLKPNVSPSELISRVLLTFYVTSEWGLLYVDDKQAMASELTKLDFALAAYRADHGEYPAKLADLTPKYAAELPKDIFNDSDLHYRREGKGFVLYSVGINSKDDGGKTRRDEDLDDDFDDLVLRVSGEKAVFSPPRRVE